jgi:hypothetical protein
MFWCVCVSAEAAPRHAARECVCMCVRVCYTSYCASCTCVCSGASAGVLRLLRGMLHVSVCACVCVCVILVIVRPARVYVLVRLRGC